MQIGHIRQRFRAAGAKPSHEQALFRAWTQGTPLDGVNGGDDEVDVIAESLAGKHAVMNFIPWNTVDGVRYRGPSPERCKTMVRMLRERGILATLRDSAAQDVEGGCGQLRARALAAWLVIAFTQCIVKSGRIREAQPGLAARSSLTECF